MARPKPKNTWVLVLSGVVALGLIAAVLAVDSIGNPLDVVIRGGALLGYLTVFLASLSSLYMRELTRYFGRPFPKVHHVVSVTALAALTVHPISVAVRAQTVRVFVPVLSSVSAFFSQGGRVAFWLLAVAALTALFRASIGKSWKVIHWLTYVAFFFGTVHALLIGPNFQHLALRIIAMLMAVGLVVVFVLRRMAMQRRPKRRK